VQKLKTLFELTKQIQHFFCAKIFTQNLSVGGYMAKRIKHELHQTKRKTHIVIF